MFANAVLYAGMPSRFKTLLNAASNLPHTGRLQTVARVRTWTTSADCRRRDRPNSGSIAATSCLSPGGRNAVMLQHALTLQYGTVQYIVT